MDKTDNSKTREMGLLSNINGTFNYESGGNKNFGGPVPKADNNISFSGSIQEFNLSK